MCAFCPIIPPRLATTLSAEQSTVKKWEEENTGRNANSRQESPASYLRGSMAAMRETQGGYPDPGILATGTWQGYFSAEVSSGRKSTGKGRGERESRILIRAPGVRNSRAYLSKSF